VLALTSSWVERTKAPGAALGPFVSIRPGLGPEPVDERQIGNLERCRAIATWGLRPAVMGRSALEAGSAEGQGDPMLIDEGLELLTEDEAMELLTATDIGRVGVSIGALPAIFPVNYRVIDGAIVFRTGAGSKLTAAAAGEVVAFEVDEHDRVNRSGWSVLVVGRAEVTHDLDLVFKALDAALEPYADGLRPTIVRIDPTFVSGRRIVHAAA
jgi:nitroimidazol reductase NimA-like FMN-containing flavoprotein (pyridoxamine 5'-phosphate oxidase superfamily)